jgi:hypothetical protein
MELKLIIPINLLTRYSLPTWGAFLPVEVHMCNSDSKDE